jgi:hypothetical protein
MLDPKDPIPYGQRPKKEVQIATDISRQREEWDVLVMPEGSLPVSDDCKGLAQCISYPGAQ